MAYNAKGFKTIAPGGAVDTGPGNVRKICHYATNDTAAVVEGAGYFNTEILNLTIGDIIHSSMDLDGTPAFKTYLVSSVTTNVSLTPAANLTFSAAYILNLDVADGSADTTYYIPVPVSGTIRKIYSAIDAAVATADITITCSVNGTAITNGVVTIATAASAAGDIDVATPSALNAVVGGTDYIKAVIAGGGAGGTPRVHVNFIIDPT